VNHDPTTFRGQLQRGRGIAARRAASEPQAGDAVYECVLDDPRWDRQVEARASYLARLIRCLELPLAPIEQHLVAFDHEQSEDIELLLDVLAALVLADREDAVGVMRRYVAGGRHWCAALNALAFADPHRMPGGWDDLVGRALAGRSDAELQEVVDSGDDSWMRIVLKRQPRIRRLYDQDGEPPEEVRAGDSHRRYLRTIAEAPRSDLLQQVSQNSMRRWALEELGRRHDEIVLDLVEDPSLRNPAGWIPGAPQALKLLGAAAVPRARRWLSGDDTMAELGIRVLATSGDHTDVPNLMTALRRALDNGEWCSAEIPAEGLGRLQVAEAAPVLHAAWQMTTHSYARGPFLRALQGCAPQLAEALADEGLDDCEPTVQEAARAISGCP
jgi:hypothetical protein